MKVLMTGATGFVGGELLRVLSQGRNHEVIIASRSAVVATSGVKHFQTGFLDDTANWQAAVKGVDVVVHLAGRAHIMHETAQNPLHEFRRVNVAGTLALARQAAAAGVRRFIFISSIKVNGESTAPGCVFAVPDNPAPCDAYGVSKFEAENGLRQLAVETGMEMVIIRPPLVYGPGVKANFLNLMHWLNRGIPLPLGAVQNKRSLVAVGNLADFIVTCMHHSSAGNETFLVSDGEDLSTTDLIRRLARAMGRKARLIPVPESALLFGATLLGQRQVAQRLLGSLQVDISKARQLLGWMPPITVDAGLRQAALSILHIR